LILQYFNNLRLECRIIRIENIACKAAMFTFQQITLEMVRLLRT